MVGYDWFVVGSSVILAGFCSYLIVPVAIESISRMQRTVQIRGKLSGEKEGKIQDLLFADLCINGVLPLRLPAGFLSRFSFFKSSAHELHLVLATRIPGCNKRAAGELLFALCLVGGLLVFVLTGQAVLALIGIALPFFVVRVKTRQWLRERKSKLREQLPDALRGLGMCFMAGLSLEQAFEQTTQECREPLKRELSRTVDELRTGSSIMEALESLDKRISLDDMRFVSVAMEIQHRTGGSMREVLDAAADSMLASFDLSRSLEVQTAQARMSAKVVSILPIALVAVLSLTMEGYLATFFSSTAGLVLLFFAVGMQLAGIFAIRKILGINLE